MLAAASLVDGSPILAEGDEGFPFVSPSPVAPITERWVCNLNDQPGARAADIQGQDGGASLSIGPTTYWFFGDTEYTGSPWKNIRNNVAYTKGDTDASDCVALTHKAADNGAGVMQAQPLLSGSIAWPAGPAALQEGYGHFFWIQPREADPQVRVQGVGIGRFDTTTLDGERLNDGAFLWDNDLLGDLNLSVASSVVAEDADSGESYLYVFFNSTPGGTAGTDTDVFVGRVPASCGDAACPAENEEDYQYWAGPAGWVSDLGEATPTWHEDAVHNGPNVAFDPSRGKWTAAYALFPPMGSTNYRSQVRLRVADELQGPWSESVLLIDCLKYQDAPADGLDCYSAAQHPELSTNGGRTQYVTFSTNYGTPPRRVYHEEIHEVQLAAPVWQCDSPSGKEYVAGDAACPAPEGIAFYAIDPATGPPPAGFEPVFRWADAKTGEVLYARDAPAGAGWTRAESPAFYAPDPEVIKIASFAYDPVYRWDAVSDPAKHAYSALPGVKGYVRSGLAFVALCPDADGDQASDCRATHAARGEAYPDTDGDGCDDARELGTSQAAGGRRDPASTWDFFDTPDPKNERDTRVTIGDVMGVVLRYGQRGDPSIDPHSGPTAGPIYHPAFDRSSKGPPADPWDLGPPDGAIAIMDILLAVRQFGHTCSG